MSENNTTKSEENLNEVEKVTIKINCKEVDALDILNQFRVPFPPVSDLDEIHLIIQHDSRED